MNRLLQSVDAIRRRFSRRISGAAIGIITDHAEPGDLAALGSLAYRGRLPLVRTENRGDPASAQRIMALLEAEFPLLVTVPFGKGFGPVGAGMALQIDHEPDLQSPSVSPEQYGQTFRSTMLAMRHKLPETIPIATASFSPFASTAWIGTALLTGAGEADAICFSVEGHDLAAAFAERLGVMRDAMRRAGCEKPLWLTELRPLGWTPRDRAAQLKACLASPLLRAVDRVYVSTLASGDADLIGLCEYDDPRTPRPAFGVLRAARRHP